MISRVCSRLFAIDVRSLGAFRVAIALCVLFDVASRARDLEAHYTDAGVLPRVALLLFFPDTSLSFGLLDGGAWFAALLFALTAAAALAMLVGWRTRLATAATWLLVMSIQERNPIVLHSGDDVLRLLLFWSLFVPLDRRGDERVVSAGTAALLLQVAAVYLFTALLKNGDDWWRDGNAVENALRLSSFATSFGGFLLSFPTLLRWLTRTVLVFEFAGPLLLFLPFGTSAARLVVIPLFALLQLGFGLSLSLGGFPWVMTAAMLLFVPSEAWRRAAVTVREPFSLAEVACAVLGVYAIVSNLASVGVTLPVPSPLRSLGAFLRVDQEWRMFTPYPSRDDGWLVFPGRLLDGSEIDVFRGEPVLWRRPPLVSATYVNTRWRKLLLNLVEPDYEKMRPLLLRYLCERWNRESLGMRHASSVSGYFMADYILPGIGRSEPSKTPLGEVQCLSPRSAEPAR